MHKVVLISILVMSIVLPAIAAREPRPVLALRRAVWWMVAGTVVYVLSVMFIYPRFVG